MGKKVSKARLRKNAAKEVERLMTANGGYSKAALASLGVSWPPPKGWKKALVDEIAGIPVRASVHRMKAIKSGSRKVKSNAIDGQ